MNSYRNVLIYLAIIHDGNYDQVLTLAARHYNPDYRDVERVVGSLKCQTLTLLDPEYPQYLKRMTRAPMVLFYYGDISLIDDAHHDQCLGVVGTRDATEYGLLNTEKIVKEVANDCIIVSGMAKGIDTKAHEATLDVGGKTVAVLGSGIDNPWPYENILLYKRIIDSGGLVISEYPNMSAPDMFHFPIRNRLIAMFSNALLVTEAHGQKTGTSITTRFALEYGIEVMAIPYPVEVIDSFCNHLIYEGAKLVRDGHDVLIDMNLEEIKII